MIARVWHGWTSRADAEHYEQLLRTTVLPGIRQVKGYRGAHLLRRDEGEDVAFVTITYFASADAVRAFAGDDAERAVISPRARQLLSRFDERAQHYHVVLEPDVDT